jgi:hypothetical protein
LTHRSSGLLKQIDGHLNDLEARNPKQAQAEEMHLRRDEARLGYEVAISPGFKKMEKRP